MENKVVIEDVEESNDSYLETKNIESGGINIKKESATSLFDSNDDILEVPTMKIRKKEKKETYSKDVVEIKNEVLDKEESDQTPLEKQIEMIKTIKSQPGNFLQNQEMDQTDFQQLAREMRNNPEAMKEIKKLVRERGIQNAVLNDDDDDKKRNRREIVTLTQKNNNSQIMMTKKEAKKERKKMRSLTTDPLANLEEPWKCVKITRSKQLKPFLLKKTNGDEKIKSKNIISIMSFFQMNVKDETFLGLYACENKDLLIYYDKRNTKYQNETNPRLCNTNKVIKNLIGFDLGAEVIVCSSLEDEDLLPTDKLFK
jgi:hypothetical protein